MKQRLRIPKDEILKYLDHFHLHGSTFRIFFINNQGASNLFTAINNIF